MGRRLEDCLVEGRPAFGIWMTLRSPDLTEIVAASELDWVCLDLEHTDLSYADLSAHLRAARRSDITVLVRIPHLGRESIQRSLDLGADGIVVPMTGDAEQARQAVDHALYPPDGARGISPARANDWNGYGTLLGHVLEANRRTLVIPMIESREGAENLEEILSVPGVRGVFVGLADLSATHGDVGGVGEDPAVAAIVDRVLTAAGERGLRVGVTVASPEDAQAKLDTGYRMIGIGSDMGLFAGRLAETIAALPARSAPRPAGP